MMDLSSKIETARQQRKVYVIGAAFIDLVMNTPSLPTKGDDVFVDSSAVTVGGCALNIARIHKSLGLDIVAAIPVGQGLFANHVRHVLAKENIELSQERASGDNGWCIAMVEADGERTFLSSEGVESDWTIDHLRDLQVENNGIVYLSGYQLAADNGDVFIQWLEELHKDVTILVDLGARLVDLSKERLQKLYDRGCMFTLNRREAELLAGDRDIPVFCETLSKQTGQPALYRVDKDGAYLFVEDQEPVFIKPFPTKVVDSIGAGDAHAAGLLYGMSMGLSVAEAAVLGNAVASDAVEQEGASSGITKAQLLNKLNAH